MKGEFLIQVNVAFGANSGLEQSQDTFTRIVTSSSHKPKNAFSIVSKAGEILSHYTTMKSTTSACVTFTDRAK